MQERIGRSVAYAPEATVLTLNENKNEGFNSAVEGNQTMLAMLYARDLIFDLQARVEALETAAEAKPTRSRTTAAKDKEATSAEK